MRLFISHATADLEIAQALRIRIRELPDAPECFLLSDDIFPSDDWELAIRRAANDCDAIVSIVTPEYVGRPWFVAEWAAFWIQEKPWFILAHSVDAEGLFEPMRRRQIGRLEDRRSVRRFLDALTPSRGPRLDVLADEIVKAVKVALEMRALANAEAHLAQLAESFGSGAENVDRHLVESVLRSGRLAQAMTLAVDSGNSVKMRQLAVMLVDMGNVPEAARIAHAVPNRAERRTIASHALQLFARTHQQELLDLVFSVYASVRDPQRRDLRERAETLGVGVTWPDVAPAP